MVFLGLSGFVAQGCIVSSQRAAVEKKSAAGAAAGAQRCARRRQAMVSLRFCCFAVCSSEKAKTLAASSTAS